MWMSEMRNGGMEPQNCTNIIDHNWIHNEFVAFFHQPIVKLFFQIFKFKYPMMIILFVRWRGFNVGVANTFTQGRKIQQMNLGFDWDTLESITIN